MKAIVKNLKTFKEKRVVTVNKRYKWKSEEHKKAMCGDILHFDPLNLYGEWEITNEEKFVDVFSFSAIPYGGEFMVNSYYLTETDILMVYLGARKGLLTAERVIKGTPDFKNGDLINLIYVGSLTEEI